ncbi:hypothetical protein V8E52_010868 [Russula decolorans]
MMEIPGKAICQLSPQREPNGRLSIIRVRYGGIGKSDGRRRFPSSLTARAPHSGRTDDRHERRSDDRHTYRIRSTSRIGLKLVEVEHAKTSGETRVPRRRSFLPVRTNDLSYRSTYSTCFKRWHYYWTLGCMHPRPDEIAEKVPTAARQTEDIQDRSRNRGAASEQPISLEPSEADLKARSTKNHGGHHHRLKSYPIAWVALMQFHFHSSSPWNPARPCVTWLKLGMGVQAGTEVRVDDNAASSVNTQWIQYLLGFGVRCAGTQKGKGLHTRATRSLEDGQNDHMSCEQHDDDDWGKARLTLQIPQGDAVMSGKAAREDHMVSA